MKKIKLVKLTLAALGLALVTGLLTTTAVRAQDVATTNPPANFFAGAKEMGQSFAAFFKDNKSFFDQKTLIVGLDGAYSHGHDTAKLNAADKNQFGAVLTLGFPLDANGQVSVGLWAAYFDSAAFYGSFQTTLGTTFIVPSWVPLLKGEQAFVFNEGGPGYRFGYGQGSLFAQDFVGAVWKHQFAGGWTLYIDGAYGKVSILTGQVALFGVKVGKSF